MTLCAAQYPRIRPLSAPGTEDQPSVATPHTDDPPWRILLVDDDEWTRQLWRDILESYPDMRIVAQASDGREAVAMATAHQPDVILMDIDLPYLDGIQATHRIRKACPRTAIIGITGAYAAPAHNAMRTAGAAALVSKEQVLGIHDTILLALSTTPGMLNGPEAA